MKQRETIPADTFGVAALHARVRTPRATRSRAVTQRRVQFSVAATLCISAVSIDSGPWLVAGDGAVPQVVDLTYEQRTMFEIEIDWGRQMSAWPVFAGDVDGDGFGDFLIALYGTDVPRNGRSALVYGGPDLGTLPKPARLEDLRQTIFTHGGLATSPEVTAITGRPHAHAGDVDGDGLEDFFVSVYRRDWGGATNAGVVFLVYGAREFPPEVDLLAGDGVRRTVLYTAGEEDLFGHNLNRVGDINADGREDFAFSSLGIGAADGLPGAGRAYFLYGADFGGEVHLPSAVEDGRATVLHGAYGTNRPVSDGDDLGSGYRPFVGGGDFNGDGIDDALVGASDALRRSPPDETPRKGAVYIVWGRRDPPRELFADSPEEFGVELQGVQTYNWDFGATVALAGDIDRDGLDDFIVGVSVELASGAGEAWIVYGMAEWPTTARVDDPRLRTTRILGTLSDDPLDDPENHVGRSVEGLGDLDGDGFDDVLVTAHRANVRGSNQRGKVYVLFGSSDLPGREVRDHEIGVTVRGIAFLGRDGRVRLGSQTAFGGDLDGDGEPELMLVESVRLVSSAGEPSRVYVVDRAILDLDELRFHDFLPTASGAKDRVTVYGAGFTARTRVFFGALEATDVTVVSSAELRTQVPDLAPAGETELRVEDGERRASATRLFRVLDRATTRRLAEDLAYTSVVEFPDTGGPVARNVISFLDVWSSDVDVDGLDDLFAHYAGETVVTALAGREIWPRVLSDEARRDEALFIASGMDVEFFGQTVGFPGDLDGDGLGEIVFAGSADPDSIGFPLENISGLVLLLRGPELAPGRVELSPANSIFIRHDACGDSKLAGSADADGDGLREIVIGFPFCEGEDAELWFWEPEIPLAQGAESVSVITGSEPSERSSGRAVRVLGDLDGDGLDDFAFGAPSFRGEVALVFANPDGFPTGSLSELSERGESVLVVAPDPENGLSRFGLVIEDPGDFDGDGFEDVAISNTYGERDFEGTVWILFGGPEIRERPVLDLLAGDARALRIHGESGLDFTRGAAPLGDLDGDGLPELGLSCTNIINEEPRAYIIFGAREPPAEIHLGDLGPHGLRLVGEPGSKFSGGDRGPMAAGDFDGDGIRDLAIGDVLATTPRLLLISGRELFPELDSRFRRGDVDDDGDLTLTDAVAILLGLFSGATFACADAADANDSGDLNLTDAIYLLNHLFLGGAPPPAPFETRGADPSEDTLDCRAKA